MAGHARNAVVQDDADRIGSVVGNFGQGVDARMEEGRVAHTADDAFLLIAEFKTVLKPWPTEKALPMQTAKSLALSGAAPPKA